MRIGKISSINYPNGTARITYEDRGGSTTAEFSFLAWQYWMPKIGDQVLVAHVSNGSSAAVILGPTWHNAHRPIEGKEGLYRKEYTNDQGVAFERYDRDADEFTIEAGGCTITMAGGTVTIKGDLSVSGSLTVGGKITAGGDVVGGGISLDGHTHTGVNGETSGPH